MRLSKILAGTRTLAVSGSSDVDIRGLSEDSRKVQKDFLFFARKGGKSSGLDFVADAVSKGAAAVVSEERLGTLAVPAVTVPDLVRAQIDMSEVFY